MGANPYKVKSLYHFKNKVYRRIYLIIRLTKFNFCMYLKTKIHV